MLALWAFNLADIPSSLTGAVIVVLMLAAAYGAWKRDDLKTVRENNTDLTARVTILEAENARVTVERDTAVSENKTLRSVVTGEVKLTQIDGVLEDHHRQMVGWQNAADDKLDEIKRAVEEWSK